MEARAAGPEATLASSPSAAGRSANGTAVAAPPATAAPAVAVLPPPRKWWAHWLLWTGVGAVVLLSIGTWGAMKLFRTPEPPRMSDSPASLATFFASPEFDALPFDRRVAFMKQLDDREPALVEAYRNRALSDAEYRKGLEGAYLGKHLGRMKNYFQEPAGWARLNYIDRTLDKKEAEKKSEKTGVALVKKDGSKKVAKASAKDAEDVKEIKRDDSREAEFVAKWPTDVQAQWKQYHAALDERKKLRDDHKREERRKDAEAKAPATEDAARTVGATEPSR